MLVDWSNAELIEPYFNFARKFRRMGSCEFRVISLERIIKVVTC